MSIQSVRGMPDLLGEPLATWQAVEKKIHQVFSDFGYQEIRTPALEKVEVFTQAVGEATDIVEKQMYVIEREKESLALRPEGTAAFMRAVIQHQLHRQPGAQRYYYYLPMYRHERPQKGRLRQFFQFGAELINDASPEADAEVIILLDHIYKSLGLSQYEIRINSLGSASAREKYRTVLQEYFRPHLQKLDPDSQKRFERAPMRILDSKEPSIQELIKKAPVISSCLTNEDQAHYEGVKVCLEKAKITFKDDPHIVRGLDYYSRTAFEFVSDLLGAQSALVGGGRYDGLAERFKEKPIPAVGFALGMERLLLALEAVGKLPREKRRPDYFFVALGAPAWEHLYPLSIELKRKGVWVEMIYEKEKSLKAQLKQADRLNASKTLMLGDDELKNGKATLKDMDQGSQKEIQLSEIANLS